MTAKVTPFTYTRLWEGKRKREKEDMFVEGREKSVTSVTASLLKGAIAANGVKVTDSPRLQQMVNYLADRWSLPEQTMGPSWPFGRGDGGGSSRGVALAFFLGKASCCVLSCRVLP